MRKPTGKISKQKPCWLTETTPMNARFTEMRKPTGKMSKQKPCWLAETTSMNQQNGTRRFHAVKSNESPDSLHITLFCLIGIMPASHNIPNPIEKPGLRIHNLCHH
jgi:hypothetical protein